MGTLTREDLSDRPTGQGEPLTTQRLLSSSRNDPWKSPRHLTSARAQRSHRHVFLCLRAAPACGVSDSVPNVGFPHVCMSLNLVIFSCYYVSCRFNYETSPRSLEGRGQFLPPPHCLAVY